MESGHEKDLSFEQKVASYRAKRRREDELLIQNRLRSGLDSPTSLPSTQVYNPSAFDDNESLFVPQPSHALEDEDFALGQAHDNPKHQNPAKGSITKDLNSTTTNQAPMRNTSAWTTSSFSGRAISTTQGKKIPKSLQQNVSKANTGAYHSTTFAEDNPDPGLLLSNKFTSSTSRPTSQPAISLPLPSWYQHVNTNSRQNQHIDRGKQVYMNNFRQAIGKDPSNTQHVDYVRRCLHELEYRSVDEVNVKKSKLLESIGLPRLFLPQDNGSCDYPHDVRGDAKGLFFKWCRRDFDPDILRGIDTGPKRGTSRSSARLKDDYPNRISGNFFGSGDLVNGAWWPLQICALRDGAHAASQAGIHGKEGQGAYSILISGSHYEDVDSGETIKYTGTESSGGSMTDHTKLLMENLRNGRPVRVLRTASLPDSNPYKPIKGVRYDGLYSVVDSELLNERKFHHRFLLVRQQDQDPIRFEGKAKRPTMQEIEAYNNERGRMV